MSKVREAILTTEQFCVALMPGASAPIRKRRKDRKERAEAAALAAATNPGRQRRRSVVESITAMASGLFSTSTDGDPASQQGGRRKSFLATMLGTSTMAGPRIKEEVAPMAQAAKLHRRRQPITDNR